MCLADPFSQHLGKWALSCFVLPSKLYLFNSKEDATLEMLNILLESKYGGSEICVLL